MTGAQFYAEIKGWQGAIGSLLGFVALIVGALFNFRLNRLRDKRLRDEEIISVASALYAEIVLIRLSVARMANAVGGQYVSQGTGRLQSEDFDKHFLDMVALPELTLWPVLASKVGMLPSHLALQVVNFYAGVEEAKTWLPKLEHNDDRPYSYSVGYVLGPAIDAIVNVTPALKQIEQMAGIAVAAETPDIKKALTGQAMENDMFEGYRAAEK
jgi:hypothetical protein